jgi:hypothetical protein
MASTRRLAAILAADVAGYSRLIGADEGGTLQALKAIRAELLDPTIGAHNGRLVKTTGDGLLVEFSSVVDALRCATEVQSGMTAPFVLMRELIEPGKIVVHLPHSAYWANGQSLVLSWPDRCEQSDRQPDDPPEPERQQHDHNQRRSPGQPSAGLPYRTVNCPAIGEVSALRFSGIAIHQFAAALLSE